MRVYTVLMSAPDEISSDARAQIMEAETFGQRQDLVILGEVTLSVGDVDCGLAYGTRSMSQGPTPLPRSLVTKNSPGHRCADADSSRARSCIIAIGIGAAPPSVLSRLLATAGRGAPLP